MVVSLRYPNPKAVRDVTTVSEDIADKVGLSLISNPCENRSVPTAPGSACENAGEAKVEMVSARVVCERPFGNFFILLYLLKKAAFRHDDHVAVTKNDIVANGCSVRDCFVVDLFDRLLAR